MRIRVRGAAAAMCCGIAISGAAAAPAFADDWSGLNGGPTQNLERAEYPGLDIDQLWAGPLESPEVPDCTTAVGGQVYVVVEYDQNPAQDVVHAIDVADGSIEWSSAPISSAKTCPAVDDDHVYVTRTFGPSSLVALDRSDGSVDWDQPWGAGQGLSYPMASEDVVVVNGYDANVDYVFRAFDPSTGAILWSAPGTYNSIVPPIAAAGAIVGIQGETTLAAVDPADGSPLWSTNQCNEEYKLISEGSIVYCVTSDPSRDVRAFDAMDGSALWSHSIGSVGHVGDIAADGDRLYLDYMTSSDGNLPRRVRALNASTGAQVWDVLRTGSLDYGVSVLGPNVFTYDDADAFDGATGAPIANAGAVPRLGGNLGSGANISPAFDEGVFFEWANTGGGYELVASTDITSPLVSITDPPATPSFTNQVRPAIEFTADDGIGTVDRIEVTLDSEAPVVFAPGETDFQPSSDLNEGAHTFAVEAFDLMENVGSDSVQITVDITPPDSTIDTGPSGLINDATPTFGFSSNEAGSTFECRFDAVSFAPCSGPGATHTPAAALSEGSHSFEVRATDLAANTDLTAATGSIIVDTIAPESTIDTGPSGLIADATPTFEFSSNDGGATFECRFDTGSFASCSDLGAHTPAADLPDGPHTFEVRAKDPATNVDPTPATRSITVDTTPPTVTITAGPSGVSGQTQASFAFGADEPGVSFECKLDDGAFEACTSPETMTGLSEDDHTFELKGTDAVGHPSGASVTRTWEVDLESTTETTAGSVNPGGSVTTDPADTGPTTERPVTASITLPDGGDVEVTTSAPTTAPPTGFAVLGQQFDITAPDGSIAEPLVLTFRLDASAIPAGTPISLLTVTRDAQPADDCTGLMGTAIPDPCVAGRTLLPDGDVLLTIRSTHASTWNVAKRPTPPAVTPTPPVTPTKKKCKKGQKLKKGKCVKKGKKKKKK